jgi:transposase
LLTQRLKLPRFRGHPIFEFSESLCAGVPPAEIELVRAGRGPEELAKEFEPSAQAIRNWVAHAGRDEGRRAESLTTAEREELNRLRREIRQLKLERDILSKSRGLVRSGVISPKGSNS